MDREETLVDGGIPTSTKVLLTPIKIIISYQIIDAELKQIEKGFDGGIFLNITIGAASAAVSLFGTILATTFETGSMAMPVLLTVAITLTVFSVIFFALYYRTKKDSEEVFREFRSRKSGIKLPESESIN